MPSLVLNLNVSKCSCFMESSGRRNHVPRSIPYLLLAEWVMTVRVWACGNAGCNVSPSHRHRHCSKGGRITDAGLVPPLYTGSTQNCPKQERHTVSNNSQHNAKLRPLGEGKLPRRAPQAASPSLEEALPTMI